MRKKPAYRAALAVMKLFPLRDTPLFAAGYLHFSGLDGQLSKQFIPQTPTQSRSLPSSR